MLRVLLAIIFLGLGVGAVVYSVYNSEKSSNVGNANTTVIDYFNIHVDQACHKGTFTIETFLYLSNSSDVPQREMKKIATSWIQDDTHQRLYLRLGLTPEEWVFTDYVHPTFAVRSTKNKCTKNYGVTYSSYIASLGVEHLKKSNREDRVFIDGKDQPIIRYDGAPDVNISVHGVHPAVIFAYTDPNNGATYGLEMFFPLTATSSLFRTEFWFANMTITSPDSSIFFDYPPNCEFSVVNITRKSILNEVFIEHINKPST